MLTDHWAWMGRSHPFSQGANGSLRLPAGLSSLPWVYGSGAAVEPVHAHASVLTADVTAAAPSGVRCRCAAATLDDMKDLAAFVVVAGHLELLPHSSRS